MSSTPNILLIITDNQSAGLLGCYGNADMHAPHLDRMAAEGLRFDNAFCPNAMCSPCRASIFTGHMPSGHGVHTWIDDRLKAEWPENWNAVEEFETLPEKLKTQGYATAIIGKYHLGVPTQGQNGIDHWVTMEKGHTLDFHGNLMSVNGRTFTHEGHSVPFFIDQAKAWIDSRKDGDPPFFLILALNGPYGHWPSIKGEPDNPFFGLYRDLPMTSVPREGLCPETIALYDLQKSLGGKGGPDYSALLQIPNDLTSLRNYYSQMSLIDDGIGGLMECVREKAQDTLSVFTADHGFSLGQHGFWGHGQATWPSNCYRAAYNIPLAFHSPGRIPAGTRQEIVSSLDLCNTLAVIGGAPADLALPSRDLSDLLTGTQQADWAQVTFHEQEESRAIRTPDWLYVARFQGNAEHPLMPQLFDLNADPGERVNRAGEAELAEIEADLAERLAAHFAEYADPRFDLWTGGRVKSNTSRPWLWPATWGPDWRPTH